MLLSWLVVVIVGCGARTTPLGEAEPVDALDAAIPDDATHDAPQDSTDVADGEPRGCPARRPRVGASCDEAIEGLSCVFGVACRVECVCERGSWVCASDTCADDCPPRPPVSSACARDEIDRVCVYPFLDCPTTCRCDPIDGGAGWACTSPPPC